MKTALIDIGSNTIRLVVYDGKTEIENIADYAGIIADVENGKISDNGIFKIVNALTMMKARAEKLGCESIYAFATASLRDIKNKARLISDIKAVCGIEIEIISGEKEAEYDYCGLKSLYGVTDGAAFDLGGGSCQLMVFRDDTVCGSVSLPLGSLKLHKLYVEGDLPNLEENKNISEAVRKSLANVSFLQNIGFKEVYAMGGAVFALSALTGKNVLSANDLCYVCGLKREAIEAVVPKRVKTVIPAALTMLEILYCTGAEFIIPAKAGVRDGVLFEKLHKYAEK